MGRFIDITGKTFGKLTVVRLSEKRDSENKPMWVCFCECSPEKTSIYNGSNLREGKSKSCGCGRSIACIKRSTTHGQSKSPTYKIWKAIKYRCNNPKCEHYSDYGGRGIKVCERWLNSYENFIADMGERPSRHYWIERKDNNGNYCPENCCWKTQQEQARNKRNSRKLTFNGQEKCIIEWSEITGISRSRIAHRIDKKGWSVDRALTQKVRNSVNSYASKISDSEAAKSNLRR